MQYDLLIKNGTAVSSKFKRKFDIAIKNGKIAAIFESGICEKNEAVRVYDADGQFVLPGIVDAHVHFRTPGLSYKEDFATGSNAAVHGGVTTVLDMPNVKPITNTRRLLLERVETAQKECLVNIGFFALLTEDNIDEMSGMAEAGAVGFKIFLGTSTGNIAAPSDGVMFDQLKKAHDLDMRIGYHAENNDINEYFSSKLRSCGVNTADCLIEARPVFSEVEAVCRAIVFAQATNTKIHIFHVSCGQTVDIIRKARRDGVDVTCETAPHYLLLNNTAYSKKGAVIKAFPTIKSEADRLKLWEGIADGTIDMIATDHAPHTLEEKSGNDIWKVTGGVAGVEIGPRLMLNEVSKGNLTINQFVKLYCERPSEIWRLNNSGFILPGARADITVVDMSRKSVIKDNLLHGKNNVTAFDNTEVVGAPVLTIVAGKVFDITNN